MEPDNCGTLVRTARISTTLSLRSGEAAVYVVHGEHRQRRDPGFGGGDPAVGRVAGDWLSRREAADILGVRPGTVGPWEANGLLRGVGIAMRETAEGHPEYSARDVCRVRGEMTVEVRAGVDGERAPAIEEALRAGLPSHLGGAARAAGPAKGRAQGLPERLRTTDGAGGSTGHL